MADPRAWWALPQPYKDLLQELRQEGKFGGETGVGIGRSPYFWGQSYGNPAANISPQYFIEDTLPGFYTRFQQIVNEGV